MTRRSSRDPQGAAGAHLEEHELIDALEDALTPDRLVHIAGCAGCAHRIEDLRTVAAEAAAVEVPEPPAFFWNQLSARVRAAVAEEPEPAARFLVSDRWWARPAAAVAMVVLVAGLVAVLTGVWPRPSTGPVPTAMAVPSPDQIDPMDDGLADIDQDEAWAMVRTLAEDLDHDQMDEEGVSARPGSADHLTLGLNDRERVELARLLEEQLKGRTLPESAS